MTRPPTARLLESFVASAILVFVGEFHGQTATAFDNSAIPQAQVEESPTGRTVTPQHLGITLAEVQHIGWGLHIRSEIIEYQVINHVTTEAWHEYRGPFGQYAQRWGPAAEIRNFDGRQRLVLYFRDGAGRATRRQMRLMNEQSANTEWTALPGMRLDKAIEQLTHQKPNLSAILDSRVLKFPNANDDSNAFMNYIEAQSRALKAGKLPNIVYTLDRRTVVEGNDATRYEFYNPMTFPKPVVVMRNYIGQQHQIIVNRYGSFGDLETQQSFVLAAGRLIPQWQMERAHSRRTLTAAEFTVFERWLAQAWVVYRQRWTEAKRARSRLIAFDPKSGAEGPVETWEQTPVGVKTLRPSYDRYGYIVHDYADLPLWFVWCGERGCLQ